MVRFQDFLRLHRTYIGFEIIHGSLSNGSPSESRKTSTRYAPLSFGEKLNVDLPAIPATRCPSFSTSMRDASGTFTDSSGLSASFVSSPWILSPAVNEKPF